MRPDLIFAPPEPCRTLTESKARTTRSRVRAGRWDAIAEICCCSATNPGGVCALRQFSVHASHRRALGITVGTARSHLSKIFDKSGVTRQAELVRLLLQR